jgi:hypothetical protein
MTAIEVHRPRALPIAVSLAPLPILAALIAVKFALPNFYYRIIQEDAFLENLQFALYLLAAANGYLAARDFRAAGMRYTAIAWYLFAVAAVLVALEEVSWFERLLDMHLGAIQSRNVQHETTIHNLYLVQPHLHPFYATVAGVGVLSWVFFRNSYVLPPKALCLYFLPAFLLYTFFMIDPEAVGHTIVWRDQEPAETLLALGFCSTRIWRSKGQADCRTLHRDAAPMTGRLDVGRGVAGLRAGAAKDTAEASRQFR